MSTLFFISVVLFIIIVGYDVVQENKRVHENAEFRIETVDTYYYSVPGTFQKDGSCIVFNDIRTSRLMTVCGTYNFKKMKD